MRSNLFKLQAIALSLVLMLSVLGAAAPAEAATDRLPDLRMRHFTSLRIQSTTDGRRLLRFTSVVVNAGVGRFEALGRRPDTATKLMTVSQRIYNSDGGYRTVSTPAVMFFEGDGHNHWHVRDLETFTLSRIDNGTKVGTGAKHAFCFFDNTVYNLSLAGAPQTARYLECGHEGDLRVRMGMSVGWGDMYH